MLEHQKAIGGDTAAMKICLDRIGPRGRDRPMAFPLPTIASPQDARTAADEIGGAIGAGAISPREAMELLRVVDKIVDTGARADAAERVSDYEKPRNRSRGPKPHRPSCHAPQGLG